MMMDTHALFSRSLSLSHLPFHNKHVSSSSSYHSKHSMVTLNRVSSFTTPEALLSLKEICEGHVPKHVLKRMEDIGYVMPTDVQRQALPSLFSGRDCIIHAQTGSGKTLTYLLLIFSIINNTKSSVQALVLVPTRELGIQVTKVARMLATKPSGVEDDQKSCTIMALLDGGTLKRHKSWLKAEPPTIVIATVASLSQMLERQFFMLQSVRVLVVDEVDFIFNSSKQTSSLRKLLNSYSSCDNRQTVFASASIPQHRRFLHDCVQQKWTKVCLPVYLFVLYICDAKRKLETLLSLIQSDSPESGIIFVGEQSEKSKKAGNSPSTSLVSDFLKASYQGSLDIFLLEDDMNFNSRAASLLEVRKGGGYLLVATDIAARGVDLPEMSHIYNFDLPRTAIDYLHRAGRTCRKPFSEMKCTVTTIIVPEERFVLQKYENEMMFNCEELIP
ncbi:PREDICTED: DEAD-box ATP-dependent RNA helicase 58, chloroplastic isoform X2 [Lupinus angustifolius]|uniref:DEAD-box ATP-dependent RNA helicase 58, chloroplastic isoform X2 n=1 Tax=Lupinus angustifolius TaxID=3871 RepID=UPI00092F4C23|nr:PREDICTED: DEAD-box ATP-dependent RNA helicase 58, chloroplastic isoform X2 [Lupinus angustifolius]